MILNFELLGLDDRRKGLDNSTHCLNEGVSVLNCMLLFDLVGLFAVITSEAPSVPSHT